MRNYNMYNFRRFALDFVVAAQIPRSAASRRTQYARST
jgi:hypothetical protein